ncbi:MAG TPA: glycerol kinase GlpK [Caulobacteraceae bacterium]|jgi:glycerol kinase|nr:glycerol kinase GlpK [Caulobacteraceae bacterium]
MGEPLILALDQGTTSTRAILFDPGGRALAEASRTLAQAYPADGWVEHDPEAIFADSAAVLREAVDKAGRTIAEVSAIGLANQRETVVVWDRATGRPIHPAIVWQDRRTAAACERLRGQGLEPRIVQETGLLLDPYFSATKIAWILDAVEGARARAARGELLAGTIDTWLIWKLTGGAVHATDATNASRTLLMDLERQTWSEDLCALFGVPIGLLPDIRDCAGDFGRTDPSLLGAAAPIRGVAGDQQAALMGQGCIRAGEVKATFGTGCFMLLHTGEVAPRSSARLLTTVAARLGGRATYALEGSIFMAGAAIQWLNQGLGIAGGPTAAEALARAARPGHGVIAVPAFTGLGAPYWDADARGAIFGLTRDAGLPEIAEAMFDACAFQARDLIEAMLKDAPRAFADGGRLRVDGGMARSAWFGQRLADLTGLPAAPAAYAETTALGAALFAGLGAGLYDGAEAAAAVAASGQVLVPAWTRQDRQARYRRWRAAVRRTRS